MGSPSDSAPRPRGNKEKSLHAVERKEQDTAAPAREKASRSEREKGAGYPPGKKSLHAVERNTIRAC
jgi:hypothetical protein